MQRTKNKYMADYRRLIESIQGRYNPDFNREVQNRSIQDLAGIDRDVAKYVKLAMNEVDELYTQKTLEAGENAKTHLRENLRFSVDFEYQGSVMTRTHIRGASDIDLLTITKRFNDTDYNKALSFVNSNTFGFGLDRVRSWLYYFNSYTGNANADLMGLRLDDERVLRMYYSQCDTSKPKSIKITNLHLHRDVDVVVASWHDSLNYIRGYGDEYRGVQIYDKNLNTRLGPDFPFLSIKRINQRSLETGGRLKKMIRFLKNVRTDSENIIDLTSFEINAICYDIPVSNYQDAYYLDLVRIIWLKLYNLCTNQSEADNLVSVDGTEYVFRDKPNRLEQLKKLKNEVFTIFNELDKK